MVVKMKIRPSVLLMTMVMVLHFPYEALAMTCETPLGVSMNCPTVFNDNDKAFCCQSQNDIPYCCDIGEYISNNTTIIAGVAVAGLIVLLIITLCCCCFCSCCLLAKRRNRTVYGPVSTAQTASSGFPLQPATMVHLPPSSNAAYPSPPGTNYYSPPPPGTNVYASPVTGTAYPSPPYPAQGNYQPPLNPHYPHPN